MSCRVGRRRPPRASASDWYNGIVSSVSRADQSTAFVPLPKTYRMPRSELAADPPVRRPNDSPSYLRVLLTFARNSLIRDMTFRDQLPGRVLRRASWTLMNLGFYLLVFRHTTIRSAPNTRLGARTEFFVFLATTWIVNSLCRCFFMPNAEEFSELIRTGNLDFALLKPIDTQFLISFTRSIGRVWESSAMGVAC
jgi:hypothetical protein